MTERQAERITSALQMLAEFEQLKVDDLLEKARESEESEKEHALDSASDDAEFESMKSRMEVHRKIQREAMNSIGATSEETNEAIADNYRRQDELFEKLAALAEILA